MLGVLLLFICEAEAFGGYPWGAPADPTDSLSQGEATFVIAPNGLIYAVGESIDEIISYRRDAASGELTRLGKFKFSLLHNFKFHPSGRFAYASGGSTGEESGALKILRVDERTGDLSVIGAVRQPNYGSASTFEFSKDGKTLYSASVGGQGPGRITIYAIDADRGTLTPLETLPLDVGFHALRLDPSGTVLYALDGIRTRLSVFKIGEGSTRLSLFQSVRTAKHPTSLSVHPGGKFLYLGNGDDSQGQGIEVFKVLDDGTLKLAEYKRMEVAGYTGIAPTPISITVDAGGGFAYVALPCYKIISVYAIDPSTGALSLVGDKWTARDCVVGMSVTISPDGKFAYSPAGGTKYIYIYRIHPVTGALIDHRLHTEAQS